MTTNLRINKNCQFCGEVFVAKTLTTKYCSHKCNSRHYKVLAREKKIAQHLGKETEKKSSENGANAFLSMRDKEYLSITEAAALIGVSKRTIERLISAEKLQVVRLNRRVIISKKNIDILLQL
ncbi:helix-turn-helix domain-containing protein [Algoriphagus sp. AK58]|uniref:helix-turn-helix domain-containing protein n=1 Tax=Algoriphagus sp. AK58 TaxID=1406877 RepID=UPI001650AFEA|nr:helix-turn-helix domain-containing protein [Algoriphagus sp. AK58]MBC6368035.1 DNA-binding protein [Algoriphagus sp. AK58]